MYCTFAGDNEEADALATFGVTFIVGSSVQRIEDLEQAFYDFFDGTLSRTEDRILITVYREGINGTTVAKQLALDLESTLKTSIISVDLDLVDTTEIARRTSRTRQNIQQLVTGARGPGAFPIPLGTPGGKRIWDWASVNDWFRNWRGAIDNELLLDRTEVSMVNAWLGERKSTVLIQVNPGNPPLDPSVSVWRVYSNTSSAPSGAHRAKRSASARRSLVEFDLSVAAGGGTLK